MRRTAGRKDRCRERGQLQGGRTAAGRGNSCREGGQLHGIPCLGNKGSGKTFIMLYNDVWTPANECSTTKYMSDVICKVLGLSLTCSKCYLDILYTAIESFPHLYSCSRLIVYTHIIIAVGVRQKVGGILNTHCYRNPPHDLWARSGISFFRSPVLRVPYTNDHHNPQKAQMFNYKSDYFHLSVPTACDCF